MQQEGRAEGGRSPTAASLNCSHPSVAHRRVQVVWRLEVALAQAAEQTGRFREAR